MQQMPSIAPVKNIDIFRLMPESTRIELIENTFYMPPSPVSEHQSVSSDLMFSLMLKIRQQRLGIVFAAPFDVYLDEDANAVQPDIIFVTEANRHIIQPKGHIHGVPDLLIEILSGGNEGYDKNVKYKLYQKFGVKEYWIVDPQTRQCTGFALIDGIYKAIGTYSSKLVSKVLESEIEF
jgi:Uma2 family endonuclease